jgi:hypothetical protein
VTRAFRHLPPWLAFWVASFWLWMLLVGEWNRIELVAAACAATATATFAERARVVAARRARVPLARVPTLGTALVMVFVDFGIVVAALARSLGRREIVRGRFVVHELRELRGDAPRTAGNRAWTTYVATISPNAYVVDVDDDSGTVLLHDLVQFRKSEEPAA